MSLLHRKKVIIFQNLRKCCSRVTRENRFCGAYSSGLTVNILHMPRCLSIGYQLVTLFRSVLKALGGRILLEVGHGGQALLPVRSLDPCDQPPHTPATMFVPLRLTVSHQTVRQHKGFLFSVTSCQVCVHNNYKSNSAICSVPNDGPDSTSAG